MAGQDQAEVDVAVRQPRLGAQQERRQLEQLVPIGFARHSAHGPPGARRDIDQVVDRAGGRAAREVQAKPQVLQQARLEAHIDRRPHLRMGERQDQGLQAVEGARMGLALRQGAGRHRRCGREAGQSRGVVEQGRGPLAHRLKARRTQLFGHARAVAGDHPRSGLQDRLQLARGPAGHVGRVPAMLGRQQIDDRPALAVGPGGEHIGVVFPFHLVLHRLRGSCHVVTEGA